MNPATAETRLKTRDVRVKVTPQGFTLLGLTEEPLPLSPLEAENLMTSLLRRIPGVPDAIERSWEMRERVELLVFRHWHDAGADEPEVRGYQAFLAINGHRTKFMTGIVEHLDTAVNQARALYGGHLPALPSNLTDAPGSLEKATEDIKLRKLLSAVETSGMSLMDFIKANSVNGELQV